MPDGKALAFIETRAGVSNLWRLPLDGGKPTAVTNFTSGKILSFDWSPDGKQLAVSRGVDINDVVLINDVLKASK